MCVHPVARGQTDDARCSVCHHYAGASRGLGDKVHAALDAIGVHKVIQPCGGCAKRRAALNAAFPIPDEPKKDT